MLNCQRVCNIHEHTRICSHPGLFNSLPILVLVVWNSWNFRIIFVSCFTLMVYLYPFAYTYTFIPNTINIIVAIIIYIYWIGISSPLIQALPGTCTTYCIYICIYIHMHIHANVYTHIWLYVYVSVYFIYIHTHIYIYIHTAHTRYQTRFLRGPHLEQVKYNVHCSLFWERCPCLMMGRFFLQYHRIRPNNPPKKCNSIGVYKKDRTVTRSSRWWFLHNSRGSICPIHFGVASYYSFSIGAHKSSLNLNISH